MLECVHHHFVRQMKYILRFERYILCFEVEFSPKGFTQSQNFLNLSVYLCFPFASLCYDTVFTTVGYRRSTMSLPGKGSMFLPWKSYKFLPLKGSMFLPRKGSMFFPRKSCHVFAP